MLYSAISHIDSLSHTHTLSVQHTHTHSHWPYHTHLHTTCTVQQVMPRMLFPRKFDYKTKCEGDSEKHIGFTQAPGCSSTILHTHTHHYTHQRFNRLLGYMRGQYRTSVSFLVHLHLPKLHPQPPEKGDTNRECVSGGERVDLLMPKKSTMLNPLLRENP